MRLEGGHVQIGNEIDDAHRAGHEGDLVLFIPKELDHLEKG